MCVTVGSGMENTQATLPASTAWSVGVGDVCVIVGSGMENTQATLPASTAWSVGVGDVCVDRRFRDGEHPSYVASVYRVVSRSRTDVHA